MMEVGTPKSPTGEIAALFVTPQLVDRIVGSPRNLLAIDTARGDEVLAQFRQYAVRSGSSIYAWTEGEGITSLREREVSVPGSIRLPDALRYIQASAQFGVYLFLHLGATLRFAAARNQVLAQLRTIGRGKGGGNVRKIVLIDTRVSFTEGVDELFDRIVDDPGGGRRLRLRDGRWLS
jgi:hypothetical protein